MNKFKIIFCVIIIFVCFGFYYILSEEPIGNEIETMEIALEKHFNCNITKSSYTLMLNHHSLSFTMDKESSHKLTTLEVHNYLATKFESFLVIDDFILL